MLELPLVCDARASHGFLSYVMLGLPLVCTFSTFSISARLEALAQTAQVDERHLLDGSKQLRGLLACKLWHQTALLYKDGVGVYATATPIWRHEKAGPRTVLLLLCAVPALRPSSVIVMCVRVACARAGLLFLRCRCCEK